MSDAAFETLEHLGVALFALLGSVVSAYYSYRASVRHTNGKVSELEDRLGDLEEQERESDA